MKIRRIRAVSFSPTGGTKKIVRLLADTMGEKLHLPVEEISFTLPEEESGHIHFPGKTFFFSDCRSTPGGSPIKSSRMWKAPFTETVRRLLPSASLGTEALTTV